MKKQPNLTTRSLMLRPFELADAKLVQRYAGDERVADVTLNIPMQGAIGSLNASAAAAILFYEALRQKK